MMEKGGKTMAEEEVRTWLRRKGGVGCM